MLPSFQVAGRLCSVSVLSASRRPYRAVAQEVGGAGHLLIGTLVGTSLAPCLYAKYPWARN